MNGEQVSVRVKPNKGTVLAELNVIDQIKLIFANFQNKDAEELNANKIVSIADMKDKAAFILIIEKAVEKLDGHKSITLEVSSKYLFYAKDLLSDTTGYGRYYDFILDTPDLPIRIPHSFKLTIAKKGTLK